MLLVGQFFKLPPDVKKAIKISAAVSDMTSSEWVYKACQEKLAREKIIAPMGKGNDNERKDKHENPHV
jgi:hypothetical protein